MQRVADYLIEKLQMAGASHIFFVPGSGCGVLVDALVKNKNVEGINLNHEQAAGMAALSYAQVTGGIGACLVTTGCGGTNAVTALLHAYQDNIPCVFISGQVEYKHTIQNCGLDLRQFGRQETNIVKIVSSICKYAVTLTDTEKVVYEVEKAINIAITGRKGPVWIDVPLNIQASIIDTENATHYDSIDETYSLDNETINMVSQLINCAKRPIILAGNGVKVAGASLDLKEFIYKYDIPMTFTRLGTGIIDYTDKHSIGMVGSMGASRSGSFAVQNADLVLCIGTRLSINTTGYEYEKFAREAKIIVIDIDEVEHSKDTVHIDYFIKSDAKLFLKKMNMESGISVKFTEWLSKCIHWKAVLPILFEEFSDDGKMDMYNLAGHISNKLPEDAIVVCDAGDAFYVGTTGFEYKASQMCITSGGQAEMGFALPGAVGAAFATKRPIFVFTGDGSIMMNIQELATVSLYRLPLKIVIVNNNGYACIRKGHKESYRRYIGCDAEGGLGLPSFEKLASGFDIMYLKAEEGTKIDEVMDAALIHEGPVIIEAMCKEVQEFLTVSLMKNKKRRLVSSPIEDQAPFMDRELFEKEMIVAPIEGGN